MKKNNAIPYLVASAILLFVVFIAESSNLSIQGYVIQENQKELEQMQQQYVQLNTQVAQYNAIGNLRKNPEIATMETAQFVYLDGDGALVKK